MILHPSLVLSIWLFLVMLVQVVPSALLLPIGVVSLASSSFKVRSRFYLLLRRSRWILLTLLLTFLFLTPGERLFADIPISREGLGAGLAHSLKLLTVLFAVGWLVGGRSSEWLLSALLGLLETLGIGRGKGFVVRLALTLRYAVGVRGGETWRSMLAATEGEQAVPLPATIDLVHARMTPGEQWLSASIVLAGLFSLFLIP